MCHLNRLTTKSHPQSLERLVLVIDDDVRYARLMCGALEAAGYSALATSDIKGAVPLIEENDPQLILLDLTLPHASGCEAFRKLRRYSTSPVVLLSSTNATRQKVEGLNLGADDVICRSASVNEICARVKAVLRRSTPANTHETDQRDVFASGSVEIDFTARRVTVSGQDVDLTRTEYRLLCELARNAGKVMIHEDLLARVWGPNYRDEVDYLRIYVLHLRRKLKDDPHNPRYIVSWPGVGYMFCKPSSAQHPGACQFRD